MNPSVCEPCVDMYVCSSPQGLVVRRLPGEWEIWGSNLAVFGQVMLSPFAFRLSPRLSSTAGCNRSRAQSVSSIVFCLLLSWSRWFPPSLLCHLAIFCLVVLLISSYSLVATLCSVWSTCCLSFLLYVWPIPTFVSVCIRWCQLSLFFSWFLSMVSYLVALDPTFSSPLLFGENVGAKATR